MIEEMDSCMLQIVVSIYEMKVLKDVKMKIAVLQDGM
jgi:hypothetical protein